VDSLDGILSYASDEVNYRIEEVQQQDKELEKTTDDQVQAELGMDFLSYMIRSGKMTVPEIAVNAIDLLNAAVDTVRSYSHKACIRPQTKLTVSLRNNKFCLCGLTEDGGRGGEDSQGLPYSHLPVNTMSYLLDYRYF